MQAYPGRKNPVLAALRGEITARELRVMFEHLPPGNPVVREMFGRWTDQEHLLWDISAQMRILVNAYANTHLKKGAAHAELELLPRPEDEAEASAEADQRDPVVIQQERDHLAAVLARPAPH